MKENFHSIKIFAGNNKNGNVYEELPAKPVENEKYELLASPGLVLGLAKGDTITLNEGEYKLIKHGGNFCIQMYSTPVGNDVLHKINAILAEISGSLDGQGGGALAFSAPISSGFSSTNEAFNKIRELLDTEYYYSNIYKNPSDTSSQELTVWAQDLLNKEK
ncbi:DUF4265 domain-containing protein [Acidovorax sp. GBBC 3334]|uniref:DUF4265 domain-containing protein n=1 Tax=Acidovorax sp. GBBC 3334 TaxID=2940496 RepID=UPI00230466D2|nr:DUF4265 domain-containing protein [Acidovorax sp. GBBC 3334]MDA8453804.1 DUF4265 domain-containing protein [Acidovorax sp. GBBC 3334]